MKGKHVLIGIVIVLLTILYLNADFADMHYNRPASVLVAIMFLAVIFGLAYLITNWDNKIIN